MASIAVPVVASVGGALALWIGLSLLTGRFSVEQPKAVQLATLPRAGGGRAVILRRMEPSLWACVTVAGEADPRAAANAGFRKLARFIFGANTAPGSAASSKVAMTSPVVVTPEKIAMTSPVVVAPQGAGEASSSDAGAPLRPTQHVVSFILPSSYTSVEQVPTPLDRDVRIEARPGHVEAALAWYGRFSPAREAAVGEQLMATLRSHFGGALRVVGAPRTKRYDPPWTFPLLNKCEVAVEVVLPESSGSSAGEAR